MNSEKIITALGGPTKVARLCEVFPQAVYQWMGVDGKGKQRSIPRARLMYLKAIRPEVFKQLAEQSEADTKEAA